MNHFNNSFDSFKSGNKTLPKTQTDMASFPTAQGTKGF